LKTFVTSSGVVTSVGFSVPATSIFTATGSPVTGAGTLGFTTAGTSGGIPYFSSAAALSSSAVLTANLPVIGGGAGVAPSVGSVSGTTTKFATVNVTTFATGQCVQVDASLNLTTTGSACGAGGGGTTIGTTTITGGTSGNFLYNNAGIYGERTPTQATAVLIPFSTTTTAQGVVPGSNGAAATSFLNATGAWSVPAGGAGLPLIGTGATVTTSQPLLDLSQTWNASAVSFEGVRLNITGSAPATAAAGSKLFDVQNAGVTAFSVGSDGNVVINNQSGNYTGDLLDVRFAGSSYLKVTAGGGVTAGNSTQGLTVGTAGTQSAITFAGYGRIANDTDNGNNIALHNGAAGQTFRVYNTRDGTGVGTPTNYERGVMDWTTTANTLIIGAQQLGTGQARQVNIAAPLHLGYTSGTPTANSCAGFALTTGSSDVAGKVTFTSATSCSITFANAFTNAPFCVVSPGSAASTHDAVTSTTGLAVTFGTANTSMQWHCFGS
jgi:hypothetical protein